MAKCAKKGVKTLLGLRAFIGGPICCNGLGAVGEHWRQPQKSTLKEKSPPPHTTTMATPLQLPVEIAVCSRCELPFCTAYPFLTGVNEGNYNLRGQETFL